MSGWTLEVPAYGLVFEADRLRRERHELTGELTVRCSLPGARTINGIISTADFNFSSLRARQDRAKHLAERARTKAEIDWYAYLEEFCQGVFSREREGSPSVDLRTIEKPSREELLLDGMPVPARHPTIMFGDGGAGKSLLALWWAGRLVQRNMMRVGFFDWELSGEDHRERLEQLFGADMPRIEYCRCELPLHQETDRVARVIRDAKLDYAIFDSVAIACDGPPESAEIAAKYFRALRPLTVGSLHIAHVNKSETADRRPFGSAFWHNLARSTWFIEAEDRDGDEKQLRVALHNRKANLGGLSRSVSYLIRFDDGVSISRADIAESGQLAERLSVRQRMVFALKRGSLTADSLAEETGADIETIKRTARRNKRDFVLLNGGKIGLLEAI